MNTLVQNMNKALSAAVARAGDGVTFIDYDKYFVESKGRFCENTYPEMNGNRYGLLFHEWSTDDTKSPTDGQVTQQAPTSLTVTPSLVMNGTFEGQINDLYRRARAANSSMKTAVAFNTAGGSPPDVKTLNPTDDQLVSGYSSNLVPDAYGRVFHPRANGHSLIANLVLYHIMADNAAKLKVSWPPEDVTKDTCPAQNSAAPPSSSSPSPAPSASPPPAKDTCGDWYKFLFDHFEIYGQNFDASKFGNDGDGLKKQVKGCGDLTEWSFKQLTNDPQGYQWYASGNLPIGTKACVGRAVVSAGGASPDGCTGAG